MLVTNLNKVRELSQQDRRLLFQSVLLLPCMHVVLLLLGYSRLRRVMEKLAPLNLTDGFISDAEIIGRARGIARIVSIASQHGLYRATCLPRSLLVWWLLRRNGVQSKLCFGVRKSDHGLEAHAWLEYNGIVVNDSPYVHEQYRALHDVLPSTNLGL